MKYSAAICLLAAALAAADGVGDLVNQLPTCGINCLRDAAQTVNCDITDFACTCGKVTEVTPKAVNCLATSGCSSADQAKIFSLVPQICSSLGTPVTLTGVATAAATAAAESAASSTAAGAATSSTAPAAAGRVQAAGWAGAIAAAAAFAL